MSGPDLRKAAAARALELVEPGMRLGLGTGSTAAAFVDLLGARVRDGLDVVGVPTSGSVISTGAAPIMDVGTLRMPTRGWHLVGSGEDMELNGAVPDFVLWPEPGQLPAGKDTQLEKAVAVLLEDVKAWKETPRPPLRKATER